MSPATVSNLVCRLRKRRTDTHLGHKAGLPVGCAGDMPARHHQRVRVDDVRVAPPLLQSVSKPRRLSRHDARRTGACLSQQLVRCHGRGAQEKRRPFKGGRQVLDAVHDVTLTAREASGCRVPLRGALMLSWPRQVCGVAATGGAFGSPQVASRCSVSRSTPQTCRGMHL